MLGEARPGSKLDLQICPIAVLSRQRLPHWKQMVTKGLRRNPTLADDSEALWQQVMEGNEKQHNQQMNVVIGLWKNGDLV